MNRFVTVVVWIKGWYSLQYCCCQTQQAILSARATTLLTAESQPLFSCCSPCSLPISPLSIWGRRMREGGLKLNGGQAQTIWGVISWKSCKMTQKMAGFSSVYWRQPRWHKGGWSFLLKRKAEIVCAQWGKNEGKMERKRCKGKIWQTNMHTHTSAIIITDTWHNTSQPINITPQICIGTDSHSLKNKIHLPLYLCLCVYVFISPTHIPSNLIPEAWASFPGERVNVTEFTSTPPRSCCCCPLRTLFHKNIQEDKSKQTQFCSPSSNQTTHGSSSCLTASASSQLASSFRQAASRQLPFFFKAPQAEQIRGPAQLRG